MSTERRVRIVLKTVPMPPDEALERWKANVLCAMDELREAIEAPMESTKTEHVRIKEGDPGFDEACREEVISFHPMVFKTDQIK